MTGLLTARDVAELLGVTAETVLRWTRNGELPAVRLPGTARGRLRYRPDDVEAWIEGRLEGAAPREGVTQSRRPRPLGGYAPLPSPASPSPPLSAATTEEE